MQYVGECRSKAGVLQEQINKIRLLGCCAVFSGCTTYCIRLLILIRVWFVSLTSHTFPQTFQYFEPEKVINGLEIASQPPKTQRKNYVTKSCKFFSQKFQIDIGMRIKNAHLTFVEQACTETARDRCNHRENTQFHHLIVISSFMNKGHPIRCARCVSVTYFILFGVEMFSFIFLYVLKVYEILRGCSIFLNI
jgi:hypothetical protein